MNESCRATKVPFASLFLGLFLVPAAAAVELITFTATPHDAGVQLEWETGFEEDNLGFNLYREVAGKRTLITPKLVAGSALLTRSRTVLGAGESYSWWDAESPDGERVKYWLEDVDLDGHSTWHGPIEVQPLAVSSQRSTVSGPPPVPAARTVSVVKSDRQ